MPFKIHDDLPIPGRPLPGVNNELITACSALAIGKCLEVKISDLNYANLGLDTRPTRVHLVRRIQSAMQMLRTQYKDRVYIYRTLSDTSVGIWRLTK